jgi:hypothetical protein
MAKILYHIPFFSAVLWARKAGSNTLLGVTLLYFFQEQWKNLDSTQKEQYWDLMLETYGKMVSGGEGVGQLDRKTGKLLSIFCAFIEATSGSVDEGHHQTHSWELGPVRDNRVIMELPHVENILFAGNCCEFSACSNVFNL